MLSRSMMRIGVALLALGVYHARVAAAHASQATQTDTGTISGIATDETGAAVSDVRVMATNDASALKRESRTGAEGSFTLPLLPPGQYTLRAERAGFAPHEITGVAVAVNQEVTVRVQLKVESLTESVVVTAQKRGAERLRDVPIPVTAIVAQELATNSQVRLRDYYSSIPGLSLAPDSQGRQYATIRGITTGRATNPTVSMLVDDVPYGYSRGEAGGFPDIDPSDLVRIEVLRGPQGTLYGGNSLGGLIKYVTVDPAFDRRSARVEVGTNGVSNGNGVGYNLRASANVPLRTTFALRLSGFTRQDPGYVDNPVLGTKGVNETDSAGGMVGALWQPRATVSLKLKGLYQHTRGDGLPDVDVRPGLGDLQQAPLPVPDIGRNERTVQAYSAVFAARLWRGELTAITGYNANDWSDQIDGSGALGAQAERFFGVGGALLDDDFDFKKVSQEIRWSAPLGRKVEWLSGAFYTHEQHFYNQTVTAIAPSTGQALGVVLQTTDLEATYGEYAAFANATYRFTDRVDVQIGGRLGHNTSATAGGVNSGPLAGGTVPVQPLESQETFFTYLIAPRFRATSDVMIYARFASGYRPGAPNGWLSVQQGAPASFGSDRMRHYEVGVKGGFFDERLSLDVSFYYIDWQDLQIRLNVLGGYGTNGSGAKSEGFELAGRLTPLTGLTIDAWIAYANAVLTEPFPVGSPVVGAAGDKLPFSSPYSGNVSLTQELPLAPGVTAFVGGSLSYVDDRVSNFQPATRPRQEFPSYSKTDLRAGVRRGTWTASLFVNNLTDERGVLNEDHYMPLRFTFIQPRTVGLSLSRSF